MTEQQNIYDVNMENFQSAVIEQSMHTPIIVDFWADWCEPCKQLMPTLEQITNENSGKIKLAKINIDENKEMAGQMQVRSVPTVAIIYKGQPVDGFNGNIPKSEIDEKINKILGATGDAETKDFADLIENAENNLKQGDYDSALPLFMQILDQQPDSPIATAGLAKCYINMGELEGAENILNQSEHQNNSNIQEALKILELAKNANDMGNINDLKADYENDKTNMQAGLDYATALFGLSQHEQAINLMLELFKQDKNWNDGLIKTKLIDFLDTLGFDNPISIQGRKKLSSLMFV